MTNSKNKKYPAIMEMIPLILFFIVNKYSGIFIATGTLVTLSIINLIISYFYTKSLHITSMVTVILVSFFGILTIILNDENFIKIKVTIINVFFAFILILGMIFKKNLLKMLLSSQINIEEHAWNKLTTYWIIFFLILAVINEIIRNKFSTDVWVNFKVFGIIILTIIFTIVQFLLIKKYIIEEKK